MWCARVGVRSLTLVESDAMMSVAIGAPKLVLVQPPPVKIRRKAKPSDMIEVQNKEILLSITLDRQPDAMALETEIEEGQRVLPYTLAVRLLVGWQSLGFISSFELKMSAGNPLPQMVVRFVEGASPEELEKMEQPLREQIMANINAVRQFPFVTVESPLLTPPVASNA